MSLERIAAHASFLAGVPFHFLNWNLSNAAVPYVAPEKFMQNGSVEILNRRMRDKLLNEAVFRTLIHARIVITARAKDYYTERPHSALDYQTPADHALSLTTAIARPTARDESSARRAIAHPAPTGVNINRTPVAAG